MQKIEKIVYWLLVDALVIFDLHRHAHF